MGRGLFVGLITLDCLYQVDHVPTHNEKLVADQSLLVAGGPATNAAVTFQFLNNQAIILGALGCHPLTSLIQTDLHQWGVTLCDLQPEVTHPPPLSTILVTRSTGDRAVISRNALDWPTLPPQSRLPSCCQDIDVVLIDGHQMELGREVALWARQQQIPVVVDAGSWKPGFEKVLPYATSVIAAANFRYPGTHTRTETIAALSQITTAEIAITCGDKPIYYQSSNQSGWLPVRSITVQDSLGAGDVFHGAFCHYRLHYGFVEALSRATDIAALSCQSFGTRSWLLPPHPASTKSVELD